MRLVNDKGQAVYYNAVTKHGRDCFIVKAISGQDLMARDKGKTKSRTFHNEATAEKFLDRYGYKAV